MNESIFDTQPCQCDSKWILKLNQTNRTKTSPFRFPFNIHNTQFIDIAAAVVTVCNSHDSHLFISFLLSYVWKLETSREIFNTFQSMMTMKMTRSKNMQMNWNTEICLEYFIAQSLLCFLAKQKYLSRCYWTRLVDMYFQLNFNKLSWSNPIKIWLTNGRTDWLWFFCICVDLSKSRHREMLHFLPRQSDILIKLFVWRCVSVVGNQFGYNAVPLDEFYFK